MTEIDPKRHRWGSDRGGPIQVIVFLKRVRDGVARLVYKITLYLN
jgi:hypothetical protein